MATVVIPWYAAIIGLLFAIFLILRKMNPVYSLFLGAIVGCLIGGASLSDTVNILISGTQSIMGTAIRIFGLYAELFVETTSVRISRLLKNCLRFGFCFLLKFSVVAKPDLSSH